MGNAVSNILKHNPSRYGVISDKFKHKFKQDAPVFGKPNVVIN